MQETLKVSVMSLGARKYRHVYRPMKCESRQLCIATGLTTVKHYETKTDTTQLNITLNTNWPEYNKEAAGRARRWLSLLPHAGQTFLLDSSCYFERCNGAFQNLYLLTPWFFKESPSGVLLKASYVTLICSNLHLMTSKHTLIPRMQNRWSNII